MYFVKGLFYQQGWRFEKKSHKWYFKTSQAKVVLNNRFNNQKNDKGEECYDVSVFDYATWKSTEVHDVVLSELDFEEEILPQNSYYYVCFQKKKKGPTGI